METRLPEGPRLHAASCQVKVFKLKGADRKHKQDRDKILRRPLHEQEKYQPSYDCTVLSDVSFTEECFSVQIEKYLNAVEIYLRTLFFSLFLYRKIFNSFFFITDPSGVFIILQLADAKWWESICLHRCNVSRLLQSFFG